MEEWKQKIEFFDLWDPNQINLDSRKIKCIRKVLLKGVAFYVPSAFYFSRTSFELICVRTDTF